MRAQLKSLVTVFFISICFLLVSASAGLSQEKQDAYQALQKVNSVSTIFDFRIQEPQSALDHLKLVHTTYKDKAIHSVSPNPHFVVVFMGPSVKLLTSDRKGFSSKDQQTIKQIDEVLTTLNKDGVVLEVCLVAAQYFKVDPNTFPKTLQQVPNGWISSIGYQAQGYSMVPVF